ncbi:MAG: DUF167 domain-containing protein [Chromatiales bacterium]
MRLHVQPRAARTEVNGLHASRVKLRVCAAPSGGEANREVCGFLAGEFGVPCSQVELLSGSSSREKVLVIAGPRLLPRWFTAMERS